MIGSIWLYSIPIVAFAVGGVLAVRDARGRVHCSNCVTPMSARRRLVFRVPWVFRGWVCPHCGTRMDGAGRSVSQ
jgi:hypothetical protein